MGAWGYGPFDNDTAGDMAAGLALKVRAVVESKGKSVYGYYEARAAAQFLVLSHGTDILGGPVLDDVVKLLVMMRCDGEFLASCREPKQMAAMLDRELLAVVAKMRSCKGCRRTHSKKQWAELNALCASAGAGPIPRSTIFQRRHRLRRVPRTTRAAKKSWKKVLLRGPS
jgi:hypothetical protein